MKEYIYIVRKLIEIPRNELREIFMNTKDKKIEKFLNKYEDAYYRSCLKIEDYIAKELEDRGLNHEDWVFLFCFKSAILLQEG